MGQRFLALSVVLLFHCPGQAAILEVCAACAHKSISAAVQSAQAGDTVAVGPGLYRESDIELSKPIKVLAMRGSRPVVDAGHVKNVFVIRSIGAVLSGFVIRNSGLSYTEELAGVKIENARSCQVTNNVFEGNHFAIHVANSRDCVISGNEIEGGRKPESQAGNGIHIWNGKNMEVRDNVIRGCRDGIYFEFVKESRISGNRSVGNLRYGLHFMFSSDNSYRDNLFADNESGVAIMYSKRIRMTGNRFLNSRGPAAYGILLKDISDSDIRANYIAGNTVGLYIEGVTRSVFTGNTLSENGWAIRILGDSDGNAIVKNDFVLNTFDIATNATLSTNEFSGNYWSRYRGLDLNRDGIGDEPYHPVQLTSMVMEKFGASVLLINSFFFSLLDEMENLLPALTPEAYVDKSPRVRRLVGI